MLLGLSGEPKSNISTNAKGTSTNAKETSSNVNSKALLYEFHPEEISSVYKKA